MELFTIHIGRMIKRELYKQGKSTAWLAKAIDLERTSVYKIYGRPTIQVELLTKISLALHHDFYNDISKRIFL